MSDISLESLNIYPDMHFRLVEVEDADFIWNLRKHDYKSRHLHPVGDSVEVQREWLKKYKEREKEGSEYYFVISDGEKKPQGLFRIYKIEEDRAEVGSWIFSEDAPENMAVRAELMLKDFAFQELDLPNLYFDTRLKNKRIYTYSVLQKSEVIGKDDLNYYFRLNREDFKTGKEKIKNVMGLTNC
jgi:RimJ/RimL family protein N-acetyltransferase